MLTANPACSLAEDRVAMGVLAGFHLGGGAGGVIRPPLEAGCPPLRVATIHTCNTYAQVKDLNGESVQSGSFAHFKAIN